MTLGDPVLHPSMHQSWQSPPRRSTGEEVPVVLIAGSPHSHGRPSPGSRPRLEILRVLESQ